METKSYKIKSVQVENLLRVKFAHISFEGDKVVIGGENGAGKSSVAKAIAMAFEGKKGVPTQPVHNGASEGKIIVELCENMIIEATISPDRGYKLELKDKQGGKYKSPQELLSTFNFHYGFYPQEFIDAEPKQRLETLMQILGLDFSALERERQTVFENRTKTNRNLAEIKARYAAMTFYADAPETETSANEVLAELTEATRTQESREALKRKASVSRSEAERMQTEIKRLERQIADYQKQVETFEKMAVAAETEAEQIQLPDVEAIRTRLQSLEGTNKLVSQNQETLRTKKAMEDLQTLSDSQTQRLKAIDEQKQKAVAEAKYPVNGLGFDDNGVTLDGVPFEQASDAQQWQAAIAIGFARNPKIKLVYVRYASLMTPKTRALAYELAEAKGCQVLFEIAGDADDVTVLMEDGFVKEVRGVAPDTSVRFSAEQFTAQQ